MTGTQILFTPDADVNGLDSLTYRMTDPSGATDEATVTINVTPVDDDPEPPSDELFSVGLFFTDDQSTLIGDLSDDGEVLASELAGRPVSFVATPVDGAPQIGSVRLSLPGVNARTENVNPYALFGDKNGNLFSGETLDPGEYTLTLTAYSGARTSSKVVGTQEVSLVVTDDRAGLASSHSDFDLIA